MGGLRRICARHHRHAGRGPRVRCRAPAPHAGFRAVLRRARAGAARHPAAHLPRPQGRRCSSGPSGDRPLPAGRRDRGACRRARPDPGRCGGASDGAAVPRCCEGILRMSGAVPHIAIVVGSARAARFADYPLAWLRERVGARDDLRLSVIDVRDVGLPSYNLPKPPALAPREYSSRQQRALGQRLDEVDGFLFLVNEYNHGYGAALKNMLDHYFAEFEHKPAAFFGYGNVGGSRAIEQLRQVVAELNMVSVRESVHIFGMQFPAVREGGPAAAEVFDALEPRLTVMTDHLLWWARALNAARSA
ncbi:MAG TPA: hypothetical protein DGU37_00145 [Microbacterium sp.]|nr:hypothetical protein [Microbacterium sp.]